MPAELGITLDKALDESKEFRGEYEKDEQVHQLVTYGKILEGLPRHSSTHAAGVVISAAPVDDYVPVQFSKEHYLTTQYDKDLVEELGLLKMDFLGLRTLTVIGDTIKLIKANRASTSISMPFLSMIRKRGNCSRKVIRPAYSRWNRRV